MNLEIKKKLVTFIADLLIIEKSRERYYKEMSECFDCSGKHPANHYTLWKECGDELADEIEKAAQDLAQKEDALYAASAIYPMTQQADAQLACTVPPAKGAYVWGYYPFIINASTRPIMEYLETCYKYAKRHKYSTEEETRWLCIIDEVVVVPPDEFISDPVAPDEILCNYEFVGYVENVVKTQFETLRVCDLHHVLAVVCTDGRWYLLQEVGKDGDIRIMLPYQVEQMFGADVEAYIKENAEKEAAEDAKYQ